MRRNRGVDLNIGEAIDQIIRDKSRVFSSNRLRLSWCEPSSSVKVETATGCKNTYHPLDSYCMASNWTLVPQAIDFPTAFTVWDSEGKSIGRLLDDGNMTHIEGWRRDYSFTTDDILSKSWYVLNK